MENETNAPPELPPEIAVERAEAAAERQKFLEQRERDNAMKVAYAQMVGQTIAQLREMIDRGYFVGEGVDGTAGYKVISSCGESFRRAGNCGFFPHERQAINHAMALADSARMGGYTVVGVHAGGIFVDIVDRDYDQKRQKREAEERDRNRRIRLATL